MSMFQKSVLNKYLGNINHKFVENAYQTFKKNYTPMMIERIKNLKEEEYQDGFLRSVFANSLNYTIKPDNHFNLVRELKNKSDSKKVDGAIVKNGNAIAVIELKSTKTKNLQSVTAQAFNYKNNQPHCKYVIISNFQKLHFYIEYANEYEEFDLFNISKQDFYLLYLLLSKDSIFNDIPQKIKTESIVHEEKVSKVLYEDYRKFKNKLFNNLIQNNPGFDKLTLYKKSQKLIDRFLFILFSEDRGLVPPNSISRIVDRFSILKNEDAYKPLYEIYKQYFGYMNIGRKGHEGSLDDIPAYNGGLFYPDDILDILIIDDDILSKYLSKLSTYNYSTDIDVNILGHIFEHSLVEIEEITNLLKNDPLDSTKSKRKKDGIFYTPEYITQYIAKKSIGMLCEKKRNDLNLQDIEIDKNYHKKNGQLSKKGKNLYEKLEEYKNWLLNLKIVDPACGSGAFLNQALNFLISEHNFIIELQTELDKGQISLFNIETTVLEKNLYGVDINEESVEIAKLSLWLRTAKKGRKLSVLSNNIKCGNSLIHDPNIAPKNFFNWENEFPEVFKNGGFNVVIGNPPYVGEKGNASIFEDLKKIPKWGEFYRRRSNLYYFFIKQGIDILADQGIQSLIIPREFTSADWANKVRKNILECSKLVEIVDFNKSKVFEDASISSLILTHQKTNENNYKFNIKCIDDTSKISESLFDDSKDLLMDVEKIKSEDHKPWNLNSFNIKYTNEILPLGEFFDVSQGLITGADRVTKKHINSSLISDKFIGRGIFILNSDKDIKIHDDKVLLKIENNWIELSDQDKNFIQPFYKAENLKKWTVTDTYSYILYIGEKKLTKKIKQYLLQFDKILLNRSTIKGIPMITLDEFNSFSIDDIKQKYSSAGAVQKIMRKKKWFLPLYERVNVPFESYKIVVNTKNMNGFTFSCAPLYSSGGGAGGQNFIYLKEENGILSKYKGRINSENFTMYVNAILNSSVIQYYIKSRKFNQLSTSKIASLPIRMLDLTAEKDYKMFLKILAYCKSIIGYTEKFYLMRNQFIHYIISLFPSADMDKLIKWNDMNFIKFCKILNQSLQNDGLKSMGKNDEMGWLEFFEDKIADIKSVEAMIDKENSLLDELVCMLYNLKKDEIKLIKYWK